MENFIMKIGEFKIAQNKNGFEVVGNKGENKMFSTIEQAVEFTIAQTV